MFTKACFDQSFKTHSDNHLDFRGKGQRQLIHKRICRNVQRKFTLTFGKCCLPLFEKSTISELMAIHTVLATARARPVDPVQLRFTIHIRSIFVSK